MQLPLMFPQQTALEYIAAAHPAWTLDCSPSRIQCTIPYPPWRDVIIITLVMPPGQTVDNITMARIENDLKKAYRAQVEFEQTFLH